MAIPVQGIVIVRVLLVVQHLLHVTAPQRNGHRGERMGMEPHLVAHLAPAVTPNGEQSFVLEDRKLFHVAAAKCYVLTLPDDGS